MKHLNDGREDTRTNRADEQAPGMPRTSESPAVPQAGGTFAEEPPVDPSLLDEIVGGDSDALAEILADFRRANDEDAALLRKAVADADLVQVAVTAHRMKGVCLSLGAAALGEACSRIEQVARSADAAAVAALLPSFELRFAPVAQHLEAVQRAGASDSLAD